MMTDQIGYRLRLRVRLGKALASNEVSLEMEIESRKVTLKSRKPDEPLEEARWVLFSAKGFRSDDEARAFGNRLRARIELAALVAFQGVDTGIDKPTFQMSEEWARMQGLIKANERLSDDVHGLLILPDDELTRIPFVEGTGTVKADPKVLTGAILELSERGVDDLCSSAGAVRLLNFALMSLDPLAKAVLSFSAVEALGQNEKWSRKQQDRLKLLASDLEREGASNDPEMLEIAQALRRGLHKLSLRQGVMRVLKRIGLDPLIKDWDALYHTRSELFHGVRHISDVEMGQFAHEVHKLCVKIILENAKSEGIHIPAIAELNFP